jgi:hypothetical protein
LLRVGEGSDLGGSFGTWCQAGETNTGYLIMAQSSQMPTDGVSRTGPVC